MRRDSRLLTTGTSSIPLALVQPLRRWNIFVVNPDTTALRLWRSLFIFMAAASSFRWPPLSCVCIGVKARARARVFRVSVAYAWSALSMEHGSFAFSVPSTHDSCFNSMYFRLQPVPLH
eukprot:scaffold187676_cov26-Tisochrysis_lutea.AAC.1